VLFIDSSARQQDWQRREPVVLRCPANAATGVHIQSMTWREISNIHGKWCRRRPRLERAIPAAGLSDVQPRLPNRAVHQLAVQHATRISSRNGCRYVRAAAADKSGCAGSDRLIAPGWMRRGRPRGSGRLRGSGYGGARRRRGVGCCELGFGLIVAHGLPCAVGGDPPPEAARLRGKPGKELRNECHLVEVTSPGGRPRIAGRAPFLGCPRKPLFSPVLRCAEDVSCIPAHRCGLAAMRAAVGGFLWCSRILSAGEPGLYGAGDVWRHKQPRLAG